MKKWILTVTILFSIFNFSGYVSHIPYEHAKAVQTQLISSFRYHAPKRVISLKRALAGSSASANAPDRDFPLALAAYNTLIQVEISRVLKFVDFPACVHLLFQSKTIPQSSREDKLFSIAP